MNQTINVQPKNKFTNNTIPLKGLLFLKAIRVGQKYIYKTIMPMRAVKKKLNRLVDHNVLYYGIFKDKKSMGKVYVVNPHLIRKGNKLRAILGDIFNDIK